MAMRETLRTLNRMVADGVVARYAIAGAVVLPTDQLGIEQFLKGRRFLVRPRWHDLCRRLGVADPLRRP